MTLTPDTRVGQIAAEHPLATRVFARHQIDFCCGGGRPLAEVCDEKGLDAATVLDQIRHELDGTNGSEKRWDEAPLPELVGHILTAYHQPLEEELPRLEAMARKVVDVHGDKEPVRLPQLLQVLLGLERELEEHMQKEERILFPMILAGQGAAADGPVAVMLADHDEAALALGRLRELTDDYEVPADACNTWRALWHGLEALEESLHRHIHLENNILFPRALQS